MRIKAKDYAAARATFDSVVARWPASDHAPVALQFANRALIHAELEAREPEEGVFVASEVNHAAAIASRVQCALADYDDAEVLPSILLDAINYRARRAAQAPSLAAASRAAILELSEQAAQVSAEDRDARRAQLDRATIIARQSGSEALAIVEEVSAWAEVNEDIALLNDAQYTLGSLLLSRKQNLDARAAWEALLTREQSPRFVSEVRVAIGFTHLAEGETGAALELYQDISADESYPVDIRHCATYWTAHSLRALDRVQEACAVLDELLASEPGSMTAESASHLRDILSRQSRH